jgi:hypothetical protein
MLGKQTSRPHFKLIEFPSYDDTQYIQESTHSTSSTGTESTSGKSSPLMFHILASVIKTNMASNLETRMSKFCNDANALAIDLIALLDRFLFLEGCTLATYPVRPETSLPSIPYNEIPVAVQMYATPSLSAQLQAQEQEVQDKKLLTARIVLLSRYSLVAQAANEILDAEFATLPQAFQPETTTFKALSSKLAVLRQLQQRASELPHPPEFTTHLVTALDDSTLASPFTTIYLPRTISWNDYAGVLTQYTQRAHPAMDEHRSDSTLQEKKWQYQLFVTGKREGKVQELGCEADFRRMRRETKNKESGGIMVWDVSFSEVLETKACFVDG